jgi:hypothetical protein
MEILVGEQKQDRIALPLNPARRRSLARSNRSRRECCLFVIPEVSFLSPTMVA